MINALHLVLTLPLGDVVHRQSVPLRMEVTNPGATIPFPAEPGGYDRTTITLLDAGGRILASGSGIDRDLRAGFDDVIDGPETRTHPLATGRTAWWETDLLLHLDVPGPGDYAVEARFRWNDLDLVSDRVPLRVLPIDCSAFDVLRDRAASDVVHVLTEHRGDGPRALFEFRSVHAPQQRWSGATIPDPPPVRGRIAETDFATRATFDHDYRRWIAWVEERAVTLVLVRDEVVELRVRHERATPARIAGRPIQHEDGGVSLVLRDDGALRVARFDARGMPATDRVLAAPAGALLASAVVAGKIVWLTGPPLTLHELRGRSNRILEDDLERGTLLAAAVDTKPISLAEPPRIAAAGVRRRGSRTVIWAASAEWLVRNAGTGPWRFEEWEIDDAPAHLRVLPSGNGADAVAVTATGRALHLAPGASPRELARVEPALASQATLLASTRGIEWMTARGNAGTDILLLRGPARGTVRRAGSAR